MTDDKKIELLRGLLRPREFEEWSGLAYERWADIQVYLRRALLAKLRYWRLKDSSWDNRVGARHLARKAMDEGRIKSARPSDYGGQI